MSAAEHVPSPGEVPRLPPFHSHSPLATVVLASLESRVTRLQSQLLLIQFSSWRSGGEQPAPRGPPAAGPHTMAWGCCHGCRDGAARGGKAANLFFGLRHPFCSLRRRGKTCRCSQSSSVYLRMPGRNKPQLGTAGGRGSFL